MGGGAALFSRYSILTAALLAMTLSRTASAAGAAAADGGVAQHCGDDFNKVTDCLPYATGKAPAPTKQCCASITAIGVSDAACLCYVIELTHNGSEQIRSLGIQESRLIQLPSACQIKNASISDCPKLLGIPASSPMYAIFTNTTAAASPVTTSSGTNTTGNDASEGFKLPNYHLLTVTLPFVFAVIFSAVSHIA